jgi:ATP-dependent Clp protease ATP-binding subunit ClpA
MMDNGVVTGSNGKQAECRNIILILTTNAGAQDAEKNVIGFGTQEKDYSDKDLKKFFTPEFRNRLDGIITFNKLGKDTMIKIVTKFLINEFKFNLIKQINKFNSSFSKLFIYCYLFQSSVILQMNF